MNALDNLKHRIRTEWAKLDHVIIAASVHHWRHHLVASRLATVISSTDFDLDVVFSAITTTFLTVVDQSNTCTQIAGPVWFNLVVSYDFVLCNTWPSFCLQGKAATLIR